MALRCDRRPRGTLRIRGGCEPALEPARDGRVEGGGHGLRIEAQPAADEEPRSGRINPTYSRRQHSPLYGKTKGSKVAFFSGAHGEVLACGKTIWRKRPVARWCGSPRR